MSKHFILAALQQPKEKVKIKWDFSPRAAFSAGELGKEIIAPSSRPVRSRCQPTSPNPTAPTDVTTCSKGRGYLAPTALQASVDGACELQHEGQQAAAGKASLKTRQEFWSFGPVELLWKKQNKSCRRHLLAQPWLPEGATPEITDWTGVNCKAMTKRQVLLCHN